MKTLCTLIFLLNSFYFFAQNDKPSLSSSRNLLLKGLSNSLDIHNYNGDKNQLVTITPKDTFDGLEAGSPQHSGWNVIVYEKQKNGKLSYVTDRIFEARELPLPEVWIISQEKSQGNKPKIIKKTALKSIQGLYADVENWGYSWRYLIVSFDLLAIDQHTSKQYTLRTIGGRFSEEQLDYIKTLDTNDFLIFNNIKVNTPSGIRNVGSLIYQVE